MVTRILRNITSDYEHTDYLQYSYAHADLHSFPTRRSSDLSDQLLRVQRGEPARQVLEFAHVAGPAIAAHAIDRKSTRLNSSHVAISYAVFCLKKKNR